MGRRLAEATNAWRARRTRGETGLCRFFLALVLVAVRVGVLLDFLVDALAEDLPVAGFDVSSGAEDDWFGAGVVVCDVAV
jgi:hypothetical protein